MLVGRYRILGHLKSDGFRITYLAEDVLLPGNPQCVVKQFKPKESDSLTLETARNLFDTEAQVLNTLGNHAQIPRLLASFEQNEEFYLIEEFIDGDNLDQKLANNQRLTEEEAIALVRDVLEVLKFSHHQDVIHGDIKPSHIILSQDGKVVLTGFGFVKQINTEVVTAEGKINYILPVDSDGYMPNETQEGKPHFSSDIYALGMTAIHALCGTPPSKLEKDPQTGEVIWHEETKISDRFLAILDKMVKSHHSDRYQTVDEVIRDLQNIAKSQSNVWKSSQVKSGYSIMNNQLNWYKSRKHIAIVTSLAVIGIIGSTIDIVYHFSPEINHLDTKTSASVKEATSPKNEPKPTTAAEFVKRGNQGFESGKYNEALADFEAALKLNSNLPEALSGKHTAEGWLLLSEKKYKEALAKFDKAAAIKPDVPYPWEGRGNTLAGLEQYKAALIAYEKATQVNPKYPWGWVGKGNILFLLPQSKQALAAYDKALEIKSDNPWIWTLRGDTLRALGQYKDALASYDKALEINQNYQDAWVAKGYALISLDKQNEALNAFDKAIEIDDDSAAVWVARGDLLNLNGKYEGAFESYKNAIKIDPKNVYAWREKSNALLKLKRLEASIAAADEALKITPNDPVEQSASWNTKGLALSESGKLQLAELAFARVVQLNPNEAVGWSNLSELSNRLNKYNQGLAAAEKSLKIKPTISGWHQLGNALFGQKNYLSAIAAYDQVLKLKPDYYDAWLGKGNALYKLGQYKDAVASYDKALEIQPSNSKPQNQSDKYAIWHYKGKAVLADKRYTDALNGLDKSREIKAAFTQNWIKKGKRIDEFGNEEESLDAYKTTPEITLNYSEAQANREEALKKLNEINR